MSSPSLPLCSTLNYRFFLPPPRSNACLHPPPACFRYVRYHRRSPINPSYSYGLKVRLHLPLDELYLPAINIRVRDNLFGGTIQPVLCSGEIQITRDRLKVRIETAREVYVVYTTSLFTSSIRYTQNYRERVLLHLQTANIRLYYRYRVCSQLQ